MTMFSQWNKICFYEVLFHSPVFRYLVFIYIVKVTLLNELTSYFTVTFFEE